MNLEHCAWLSRLAFGCSLMALGVAAFGACQEGLPGKEPLAKLQSGDQPGALMPDRLPKDVVVGTPAEQAATPKGLIKVNGQDSPSAESDKGKPPSAKFADPVQRGADDNAKRANGTNLSEAANPNETPKLKDPESQAAADSLKVRRLVVTTGISGREPVEVSSFSASAEPVFAFVELANFAEDEQGILVTFEHETGKRVGFIELTVPGNKRRWRTWGRTARITAAGDWTAVVSDQSGRELSRQSFSVAGAAPPAAGG